MIYCLTTTTTILDLKFVFTIIGLLALFGDFTKAQKLAVEFKASDVQQNAVPTGNVEQVVGEAVNTFFREEQVYDANRPHVQPPQFVQIPQEQERERETFEPDDFEPSIDIQNTFLPPKYKFYDQVINETTSSIPNDSTIVFQVIPVPEPIIEEEKINNYTQQFIKIINEEQIFYRIEEISPIPEEEQQTSQLEETNDLQMERDEIVSQNSGQIAENNNTQIQKNQNDTKNDNFGVTTNFSTICVLLFVVFGYSFI
eukprot:TRINITY_DN1469_c0_g1_i1.p2 TRINITY_DN1469_c0_g1~~TRINITY_DN1469_c0_g1_i1.p2  ORF type:complete len:256 (-),score=36.10 TRINITY_DN1469_c0_g1_i1:313-1080(-)